jgi:hypothetical protein
VSKRADRLAAQQQLERHWFADQQQRHERYVPPPPEDSPDYCGPNMKDNHRHSFYRGNDGKRRCYWCLAVRE